MWEQIRANRRRSFWLIIGMAALLMIMGYLAGEAIASGAGILGVLFALVILICQLGMYAFAAESILLQGMGARELSREDSPRLFNIVDEMVIASGLGFTPKIYLVDAIAPNAFAIGRKPENSAVTVTSGLMYRLSRDELQGVIAHEIGHLKNQDVRFMTLAGVLIGTIVILADLTWRMIANGGDRTRSRSDSRGNGGGGNAIIVLIALGVAILGPVFAHLLYFAISRSREYLADASAAQFTRYPEGLASALRKIASSPTRLAEANRTNAPMFIINPLAADGDAGGLFATHPPTAERIRILQSMGGGASFLDYEKAYEQATGGRHVIGRRTLGDAQPVASRPPSEEGPIAQRADARATFQRLYGYISLQCDCGAVMRIPESYPESQVICIRCGMRNEVPSVSERGVQTPAPPADVVPIAAGADATPLAYSRKTMGWESFRCTCGGTVQLGPSFQGARTWCPRCRRQIEIEHADA